MYSQQSRLSLHNNVGLINDTKSLNVMSFLSPQPYTFQKHDRMEFRMNKIGGSPTESGVVCTQLSCQDPQVELLKIYTFI